VSRLALKEKKLGRKVVSGCLASYHNPNSNVAEQYRSIRNNIRFEASGKVRSLVVTSASAGEGKSTAAVNLAISMSQRGDRVLLIDANMRKPILNQVFDLMASPGLMDVLVHQIELTDAIQETGIGNLSLLAVGTIVNSTEDFLDTQAMSEVLDQLAELYDMIILDCPAVLEKSDACTLAGKCDGAILVMKSGRTHRDRALQANLLGAVLT
jgi:capsular exopolysaccharide synthesis family protein